MNYQNKYFKYKSKHQKLKQKINMKIMELKLKQSSEENSDESYEEILEYDEENVELDKEQIVELVEKQITELDEKQIVELDEVTYTKSDKDYETKTEKDNILELIKNLLENNPKVYLHISGNYASGKSSTIEKIKLEFKEYGVYIIELDNIINEHIKDKTNPDYALASLNAFKVYKDKGTEEQTNIFIEKTKEEITKGLEFNNKLLIIKGTLSSSICKQIMDTNPLITIYFQPTNPSLHKKRIVSRIISDIKNKTYTLPGYWGPNGIFNREQIESDLIKNIDLEDKYGDKLDLIVNQCIEDAEICAEQIQLDFTSKSWIVIVKHV